MATPKTIPDLPGQDELIGVLRSRIGVCQARVDELQTERDRIRERDTELRLEQDDYKNMIQEAAKIIKVMVPPKSGEEMREEIETIVYDLLVTEVSDAENDGWMAVSRVITQLPPEIAIDYANRGLEGRVRNALKALVDRGLLQTKRVDTMSGHHAALYRIK